MLTAMKRAILLVDHGSRQSQANQTLLSVSELVREQIGEEWVVEIAHMELEPPSIAEGFAACVNQGASEVVVHPYFLAPGRHATLDIARMVEDAATAHPGIVFRVTEPLGVHALLAKLVLMRCGVLEDFEA